MSWAGQAEKTALQQKHPRVRGCFQLRMGLLGLDGVGLHALLTLDGLEGNLLAFPQGFEAFSLDGTEVDEQVGTSTIGGDKTKALGIVEPFDGSGLTI